MNKLANATTLVFLMILFSACGTEVLEGDGAGFGAGTCPEVFTEKETFFGVTRYEDSSTFNATRCYRLNEEQTCGTVRLRCERCVSCKQCPTCEDVLAWKSYDANNQYLGLFAQCTELVSRMLNRLAPARYRFPWSDASSFMSNLSMDHQSVNGVPKILDIGTSSEGDHGHIWLVKMVKQINQDDWEITIFEQNFGTGVRVFYWRNGRWYKSLSDPSNYYQFDIQRITWQAAEMQNINQLLSGICPVTHRLEDGRCILDSINTGCGDGICEVNESTQNCPADCSPQCPSTGRWCGSELNAGGFSLSPDTLYYCVSGSSSVTVVEVCQFGCEPAPLGTNSFCSENPADTQAPTAPTNLVATATGSSSIALSWNASSDNVGVVGYDVYRGGTLVTTTTSTSFTNTGLAAGVNYCFSIRSRDAAGNLSSFSNQACATTPISVVCGDGICQSATENAASCPQDCGPQCPLTGRWCGSELNAEGFSLSPDTLYYCVSGSSSVTVVEVCQFGCEPAPLGTNSFCSENPADTQAPTAPTNLVATATGSSTIALSWNASSDNVGVVGYDIYRGGTLITTTTSTIFTNTGLSAGVSYCFSIRSRDAAGNLSSLSNQACATTPVAAICGNGACESTENASSCPQDCDPVQQLPRTQVFRRFASNGLSWNNPSADFHHTFRLSNQSQAPWEKPGYTYVDDGTTFSIVQLNYASSSFSVGSVVFKKLLICTSQPDTRSSLAIEGQLTQTLYTSSGGTCSPLGWVPGGQISGTRILYRLDSGGVTDTMWGIDASEGLSQGYYYVNASSTSDSGWYVW